MQFFDNFTLPSSLVKVNLILLHKYIEEVNYTGELYSWNVALMTRSKGEKETSGVDGYFSNGLGFNFYYRQPSQDSNSETYMIRKNHILGNPKDEFVDLDKNILKKALDETNELYKQKHNGEERKLDYPSPKLVREKYRDCKHPLLMIFPLKDKEIYSHKEPYIGFAVAFPHTNTNVAVSYTTNQIADFADTEDLFDNNNDNTYNDD